MASGLQFRLRSVEDVAGLLSGDGDVTLDIRPAPRPALVLDRAGRGVVLEAARDLGGPGACLTVRAASLGAGLREVGPWFVLIFDGENHVTLTSPEGWKVTLLRTDAHVLPRRTIELFCEEILATAAAAPDESIDPETLRDLPGYRAVADALWEHERVALDLRELGLPAPEGGASSHGPWVAPAREAIHYLIRASVRSGHPYGEALRHVTRYLALSDEDGEPLPDGADALAEDLADRARVGGEMDALLDRMARWGA